jgi:hypothetical protein
MEKLVGNLYPNTIKLCRERIQIRLKLSGFDFYQETLPDMNLCFLVGALSPWSQQRERVKLAGYLLWMLDQIPTFDDAEKRARWIGYVLFGCEALGLFTNDESRAMVREDVNQSKLAI